MDHVFLLERFSCFCATSDNSSHKSSHFWRFISQTDWHLTKLINRETALSSLLCFSVVCMCTCIHACGAQVINLVCQRNNSLFPSLDDITIIRWSSTDSKDQFQSKQLLSPLWPVSLIFVCTKPKHQDSINAGTFVFGLVYSLVPGSFLGFKLNWLFIWTIELWIPIRCRC